MRIRERIVRSGYFWLPERPEPKLPGTLTIEDGGELHLEILGSFAEPTNQLFGEVEAARIVGLVEKVGAVTLDRCFETSRSVGIGGISKSRFFAHRLIEGLTYSSNEPFLLEEFRFSIDGLHEWLCKTGIRAEADFVERTAHIRYKEQDEISLQLTGDVELRFGLSWSPPGAPIGDKATITEQAYIKLASQTPKPFEEFVSIAYKVANFLCFATDRILCMHGVRGAVPAALIESAKDDDSLQRVGIVYQSLPFSTDTRSIDRHAMLFRYPQISPPAEQTIKKWFDAYDLFQPALDLYFAARSGAHKYLSGRFLSLAQALETFHRRTSDEMVLDPDEYRDLVAGIVESCPEEHSDWIGQKFAYGNEISLATRLKRIMEPLQEWLGDHQARRKLARKIVNTRNYLTHYDRRLQKSSLQGEALFAVCLKMEAILQLHLLKEIGFSSQQVSGVVERSRALQTKLDVVDKKQ